MHKNLKRPIIRAQSFGVAVPERNKLSNIQMSRISCPELEECTPSPESGRKLKPDPWKSKIKSEHVPEESKIPGIIKFPLKPARSSSIISGSVELTPSTSSSPNKHAWLQKLATKKSSEQNLESFCLPYREEEKNIISEELGPNVDEDLEISAEGVESQEESSSSSFCSMGSEQEIEETPVQIKIDQNLLNLLAIRNQGVNLTSLAQKHTLPPIQGSGLYKKKTLLLDLDHTLILPMLKDKSYLLGQVPALFTKKLKLPFLIRRGATQFVETLAEKCEIVLYSSGTMEYIADIINRVPKFNSNIKYVLSRDDCCKFGEGFLKSAKILNRSPENVIVVDDSYSVYPEDLDNVVPVVPFRDAEKYECDKELWKILGYIQELLDVEDVREPLKSKFGLRKKVTAYWQQLGGQ